MIRYILPLFLVTATLSVSAADSLHDFTVDKIDGKPQPLSAWKGKPVLIVNVASRCGFTKQYKDLVDLYDRYHERGLVVAGFPANNFGGQEPGSDYQIQQFCTERFNVNFPMFSKISVKGDDQHPLFAWLTEAENPDFTGNIRWNFEKILVDGDGNVVRRFRSKTKPGDEEITSAVEALLSPGK